MDAEQAHGRDRIGACVPLGEAPTTIRACTRSVRSACSTPAWVASRCCTSASSRCRTRTSSTPATPRASRTAGARPASCAATRRRSRGWLVREGVKLIVVACNSATATALGDLQRTLDVPVIGVLTPRRAPRCSSPATGASGCSRPRRRSRAAAIASSCTASTRGSSSSRWPARGWRTRSSAARPTTRRWSRACACTARRCARPGVDTVILGCTHYPLIRGMLQRELGRDVALVAAAEELAEEVAATLRAQAPRTRSRSPRLVPLRVHRRRRVRSPSVGRRFLQLPISSVRTLGAAELAGLALTS